MAVSDLGDTIARASSNRALVIAHSDNRDAVSIPVGVQMLADRI